MAPVIWVNKLEMCNPDFQGLFLLRAVRQLLTLPFKYTPQSSLGPRTKLELPLSKIHNHNLLYHARQHLNPKPPVHRILIYIPVPILLALELQHKYRMKTSLEVLNAYVCASGEGFYIRLSGQRMQALGLE